MMIEKIYTGSDATDATITMHSCLYKMCEVRKYTVPRAHSAGHMLVICFGCVQC